ncbi:hypothetical protein BofuT4_uP099500.1 [Botrytis cinerea T4]|uniref:Uncharacterized protein n=1 Tax=Botryotinia fuckeliana (strain T4) TaxID=999810 RepID=G2YC70_BOTF4|nr:hypothetical protein BofuT4_uP099500.1 [Botrytis cinerea T4]
MTGSTQYTGWASPKNLPSALSAFQHRLPTATGGQNSGVPHT